MHTTQPEGRQQHPLVMAHRAQRAADLQLRIADGISTELTRAIHTLTTELHRQLLDEPTRWRGPSIPDGKPSRVHPRETRHSGTSAHAAVRAVNAGHKRLRMRRGRRCFRSASGG